MIVSDFATFVMSAEAGSEAHGAMKSRSNEANALKLPPPEDSGTISIKGWVIFSFWAVAIFLGLPIWLWTTSIHRASLPTQEMLAWSEGKVQSPVLSDGLRLTQ